MDRRTSTDKDREETLQREKIYWRRRVSTSSERKDDEESDSPSRATACSRLPLPLRAIDEPCCCALYGEALAAYSSDPRRAMDPTAAAKGLEARAEVAEALAKGCWKLKGTEGTR